MRHAGAAGQATPAAVQRLVARGVRPASRSAEPGPTCIARWTAWASVIDFRLSRRRDTAAAKRYLRKALSQPHVVNPRTITVDRNPSYPRAVRQLKRAGKLWRFSRLRQRRYLNDVVEQDHRRIKRLVRPGLGFGSLCTARRTLAGYEAMAMVGKGQVRDVGGRDMWAQATFVAGLFGMVA